jgi:hypothetical protein
VQLYSFQSISFRLQSTGIASHSRCFIQSKQVLIHFCSRPLIFLFRFICCSSSNMLKSLQGDHQTMPSLFRCKDGRRLNPSGFIRLPVWTAGYFASISLTVTDHQIPIGASRWGPRLELHVSNIILSSRYRKVIKWLEKLVESARGRGYIALSEKISNHDYSASACTSWSKQRDFDTMPSS